MREKDKTNIIPITPTNIKVVLLGFICINSNKKEKKKEKLWIKGAITANINDFLFFPSITYTNANSSIETAQNFLITSILK